MFSTYFYHFRPVFKIGIIIAFLMLKMPIAATMMHDIQSYQNQRKQVQTLVIEKITAEKQQSLIHIQCSGKGIMNALAADTLDIQVNIRKKESLFKDIYIKNIDTLSENTLLISIQPPLQDALYGIEKRIFEVQFTTEKEMITASRTAMLGTTTRWLDLRAYTILNPAAYMLNGMLLFLGLSGAFALVILLLKKYNFKKQAIKKYKDITVEDKPEFDPFTFEAIEEKDEVVVIGGDMMLLRSWKRLKATKEEERDATFAPFFEDTQQSHLFKPLNHSEKSVNRMWFGMVGAYIAWLFYMLLMRFDLGAYRSWLSALFDSTSKQCSDVIYADLLLAVALGLVMSMVFLAADRIYGNRSSSVIKTLYRFARGLMILSGFFMLQFLLNVYLINNNFFGQLIAWICIGLGLALAFARHNSKKKSLITAGITGVTGFIIYQLCSLDVFINMLSPEIVLLISLLVSGSILGGLTHHKAAIQQDTPDEENATAPEADEIPVVRAGEL